MESVLRGTEPYIADLCHWNRLPQSAIKEDPTLVVITLIKVHQIIVAFLLIQNFDARASVKPL